MASYFYVIMTVSKLWVNLCSAFHTIGHPFRHKMCTLIIKLLPWLSHVTDDVSTSGTHQSIELEC